jgi:hypothetical protein
MGDLALCQEWIEDLGRDEYRFAFAATPNMAAYIDKKDICFLFQKDHSVRQTILDAVGSFKPYALIFATNAFWNLSGYEGCKFGEFILQEDDVNIPVCSFDPFETGFVHTLPQTGALIPFSAVPGWVYALRYMTTQKLSPNAVHFHAKGIFERSARGNRKEIIKKWKGDPGKKTILFPMSRDRFYFIQQHYPGYFSYLAEIFAELAQEKVQIFTIFPEEIAEFGSLPHVIPLSLLPYEDFLSLVSAADLYLTDSFVSCIVTAFHLGTPALILINSEKSEAMAPGSFLENKFFPYWIFPYGMDKICARLEAHFEAEDCYSKAEILDKKEVLDTIRSLLEPAGPGAQQVLACREWKRKRREQLPGPREAINEILKTHRARKKQQADVG